MAYAKTTKKKISKEKMLTPRKKMAMGKKPPKKKG